MAVAVAVAAPAAGGAMGFGFPCTVAKDEDQARVEDSNLADTEDWADLEPFFFDEAAAVADHMKAKSREQRRQNKEAQKKARLEKRLKAYWDARNRIYEYDPKQGTKFFTRISFVDFNRFDLDEESPLGPMRETDALIDVMDGAVCKDLSGESANCVKYIVPSRSEEFLPCYSVNVLSIKIVSSDVGFPINVYGTVIVRDGLDLKCVYLFRRDRDHCQLILTKDESLIVTGPKRGLALSDSIYCEIDLKIKGVGSQRNRQLSKGYMTLNGRTHILQDNIEVERECLDTRLSNVEVTYAVMKNAVEATFAVEVVQGRFYGEITARTTGTRIQDSVVLHDSRLVEAMGGNGKGVVQLLRRVVAVCLEEKLLMTIAARTGDGKTKSMTTKFTPGANGAYEKEISFGFVKMRVKVTWSIIKREYLLE